MADLRREVQHFMMECEGLLGFAHQTGGLNNRERQILSYYAEALVDHVRDFCEPVVHPTEPQRPTRG